MAQQGDQGQPERDWRHPEGDPQGIPPATPPQWQQRDVPPSDPRNAAWQPYRPQQDGGQWQQPYPPQPGYGQPPQPPYPPQTQYQPPQPPYGPPPPRKKHTARNVLAVIGGIIAAVIVISVAANGGGSKPTTADTPADAGTQAAAPDAQTQPAAPAHSTAQAKPAAAQTVTYEVTGSTANVTYGPAGSNSEGTVPMHVTKPLGTPIYYAITAQLQGSGSVTCKILVSGKVISQATANGGYNIAQCEISQDFSGGWKNTLG